MGDLLVNNDSLNPTEPSNQDISPKFYDVLKKIQSGRYVPPPLLLHFKEHLEKSGIDVDNLLGKTTLVKTMRAGIASFASAKPPAKPNLGGIRKVEDRVPFPKKSLTRMVSGEVKPEWLVGLGRMEKDGITPMQGYKDVFVSSLEEYEKAGIQFDPDDLEALNNPQEMAEKLDLKDDDLTKIQENGAWIILIHPGSKLAIPTERQSELNPKYTEGGYTHSDQQEWVTPNIGLDEAVRSGQVRIFKVDLEGKKVEWKFFKGQLLPKDEFHKAINEHVRSVSLRSLK